MSLEMIIIVTLWFGTSILAGIFAYKEGKESADKSNKRIKELESRLRIATRRGFLGAAATATVASCATAPRNDPFTYFIHEPTGNRVVELNLRGHFAGVILQPGADMDEARLHLVQRIHEMERGEVNA